MKKKKRLFIPCDCTGGCSVLGIHYWNDTHPEDRSISLSHYTQSWDAMQGSWWWKFKRQGKIIWTLLRGKEYYFYEIYIEDRAKMEEFKEFVANIDTEGMVNYG